MKIKFIVARKNDEKFSRYLLPSLQKLSCMAIQLLDEPNKKDTIFTKYNQAIDTILSSTVDPTDVFVFVHEDVAIVDPIFKEKVELLFNTKNVALVGIAGSTILTDAGGWWMNPFDKLRGHLLQGKDDGQEGEAFYLQKGPVGYFEDVCCIDGCLMMTTGKQLQDGLRFDDKTFNDDNDMYDIDLCLSLLERNLTIAVADMLVFHRSMGKGSLGETWHLSKNKLITKWLQKGKTFPITKESINNVLVQPKIVEIEV